MTYSNYIKSFTSTKDGIMDRLLSMNAPGVTHLSVRERLEWKVQCAAQGPQVTVCIYPYLNTHDVRLFLIDQLHRLDCAKVFFRPGVRNMALSGKDLFKVLAGLDHRDLPTTNPDVISCIAGVSVAVTLLYCTYLKKTVECGNLINVTAGQNKSDSVRAIEVSIEMLRDIRHFTKGVYDGYVMSWWDTARETPATPARYAY